MHTIRPGGWGVYFLFDGRVGSLGGREQAVQAEKKGFRFNRQTIPMSLRKQSLCQQWLPQWFESHLHCLKWIGIPSFLPGRPAHFPPKLPTLFLEDRKHTDETHQSDDVRKKPVAPASCWLSGSVELPESRKCIISKQPNLKIRRQKQCSPRK